MRTQWMTIETECADDEGVANYGAGEGQAELDTAAVAASSYMPSHFAKWVSANQ